MRIYESIDFSSDFNKQQARYEAELHDEEAETSYEECVIRTYGTKTRFMVTAWAGEIEKFLPRDYCKNEPAVTFLDYGCGTGQVSRVMKDYIKPLFAFDISQKSLLKNVKDNGVIGVLANSFYLPFKDNAFDFIFINGVLHHIVDLDRCINELCRISKNAIFISEGIPRGLPSLHRMKNYPGVHRKFIYLFYIIIYWVRFFVIKVLSKAKRIITMTYIKKSFNTKRHGSQYERPLKVEEIELLIIRNGFERAQLRYLTNIDIPGNCKIKDIATTLLINGNFGTHFDLIMKRVIKPS
jgi:ubiquinone/menaquinone biosynthesis C-methylase UbiE